MLSKKIFLSAAFVSMAGLVACGDDSSSNSNSKELPPSVPTFFDLADVECNADRKCETIIVEEGPDTYECNGEGQWNMLINSMPSKICPAEEEKKGEEGTEEGTEEGGEEGGNGEEGTEEGGEEGGNGEEGTEESGEEGGNGEEGTKEPTGPTGDVVSCLQVVSMMGITTQSCDEYAANSANIDSFKAECAAMNVEGFLTATEGTGCPKDFTKKCVVSNDVAAYFYEEENANESCDDLLSDDDDED